MAFNDEAEYPRGVETGDLTGAVNINSGNGMKISAISIANQGDAVIDVTISGTADPTGLNSSFSFVCPVAVDAVITLPGWNGTLSFNAAGANITYLVTYQST